MIDFKKLPGQRVLELGGGDSPQTWAGPDGVRQLVADVRVDVRAGPHTSFTQDFNLPLSGIGSAEFDAVLCVFCLEHLYWHKARRFLAECLRVLKPGGRAVFVVPNTEAQVQWVKDHPQGWDGKPLFEAASELLFGSADYPENTHKLYLTPALCHELFAAAGFGDVLTQPAGAAGTDLLVDAYRPREDAQPAIARTITGIDTATGQVITMPPGGGLFRPVPSGVGLPAATQPDPAAAPLQEKADAAQGRLAAVQAQVAEQARAVVAAMPPEAAAELPPPAELYDKAYFGGGHKWGGYSREGYWDYPCHELTAKHVLDRKPQSVLELGCARGYIGKRVQDVGVRWTGLEVSKHCYLTRACDGILQHDLCRTPWPLGWDAGDRFEAARHGLDEPRQYDLCFSIAVLEHVPEGKLPAVIAEMARTCKRGLHGVDFGGHDDGFDRTHVTLKDAAWWRDQFRRHAPGWPVEIVDKETLEVYPGGFPQDILRGDGKVKLNIGSHTVMAHRGWLNIDVNDLAGFAQQHGYQFLRCDVRAGLPFPTGGVDLIASSHFLEHLTYADGLAFLRECRRVLKPETGAMRLAVPDGNELTHMYSQGVGIQLGGWLEEFDEMSDTAAAQPTAMGKLFELLQGQEHRAFYDAETLFYYLRQAGFEPAVAKFRVAAFNRPGGHQIVQETLDMFPELSLYVDATPLI